jgi:methionyl-tRNA formyltransferase
MTKKKLRIVFMGTPAFAVASLDALIHSHHEVVGVITAPDKPGGRGMKMQESAIKQFAVSKGLHILQPLKLKDPSFLEELKSLQADIQVVVAFRMLPTVVWDMPPLGTINVHASLLPQYRGAAPINWAIINGENVTGVTTFRLKHEIDTGNILGQQQVPITEDMTAGELHDILMVAGSRLLRKTIDEIAEDISMEQSQDHLDPVSLKHAPKIFTDTCKIDWNKSTREIHNLVRGLSPYPGAFTFLHNKQLKIFKTRKESSKPIEEPGSVSTNGKDYLKFACADGYIYILELQLEGKKKMYVDDFLRGYRIP